MIYILKPTGLERTLLAESVARLFRSALFASTCLCLKPLHKGNPARMFRGSNTAGQLGVAPAVVAAVSAEPVLVAGDHAFSSLSAGSTFTCGTVSYIDGNQAWCCELAWERTGPAWAAQRQRLHAVHMACAFAWKLLAGGSCVTRDTEHMPAVSTLLCALSRFPLAQGGQAPGASWATTMTAIQASRCKWPAHRFTHPSVRGDSTLARWTLLPRPGVGESPASFATVAAASMPWLALSGRVPWLCLLRTPLQADSQAHAARPAPLAGTPTASRLPCQPSPGAAVNMASWAPAHRGA